MLLKLKTFRLDQSERRKLMLIVILAAVLLLVLLLPSFAGATSMFKKLNKAWITDIANGGNTSGNPLKQLPWDSYPAAWNLVTTIATTMIMPVAVAMVGFCAIAKIDRGTINFTQATPEKVIVPLLGAGLTIFFISCVRSPSADGAHSLDITTSIIKLGNYLGNTIEHMAQNGAGSVTVSNDNIKSLVKTSKGLFPQIRLTLDLMVPHLFWHICNLLIQIISYGVLIELFVRASLLPFCGVDVYLSGPQGRGAAAIKGFIAVCFVYAMLIVISSIQGALITDATTAMINAGARVVDRAGWISKILIYDFASMAVMLKASQMIREAFGA